MITKNLVIISGLLFPAFLSAQDIQFKPVPPPLSGVQQVADFRYLRDGSIASADVDGDGDMDILLSGSPEIFKSETNLYINNGAGSFVLNKNAGLPPVNQGAMDFADIDGDGDQDVVISGHSVNKAITEVYLNNGKGYFNVYNQNIEGVSNGALALFDVDNDNDPDLIFTGLSQQSSAVAELYLNDGNGKFSKKNNTGIYPATYGSIEIADVNSDGYQDVAIMGASVIAPTDATVYINDGTGQFTSMSLTVNDYHGMMKFGDLDNDNDPDLVASSGEIFINNNGTYTWSRDISNLHKGQVELADIDNNGFLDIIIGGDDSNNNTKIVKVYLNQGSGNYIRVPFTDFAGVYDGDILAADFDGDQKMDVVLSGSVYFRAQPFSMLYKNISNGRFAKVENNHTQGFSGAADFGDIDNDGDLDLITSGVIKDSGSYVTTHTTLYKNDGTGMYSRFDDTTFINGENPSVDFGDIDNDGDEDLIVISQSGGKFYKSDGTGVFNSQFSTGGYSKAVSVFVDVDNDGYKDLLYGGNYQLNYRKSSGLGSLIYQGVNPFSTSANTVIKFEDLDNDNDMDGVISSELTSGVYVVNIYKNNSNGSYAKQVDSVPSTNFSPRVMDCTDVNGDGSPDIMVIVNSGASNNSLSIYRNTGNGKFHLHSGFATKGTITAGMFFDIDNDGDSDIILTPDELDAHVHIYINDGQGNFTLSNKDNPFDGYYFNSITVGDIDGDSDLDILFAGQNRSLEYVSRLYRNLNCAQAKDTITEVGCNDYTWKVNYRKYISTGVYTDTVPSLFECDSLLTLDLTVLPVDTSVTQQGFTLSANANSSSFQWIDCLNGNQPIQGETSSSFTASQPGIYAVVVTQGICSDTSDCFTVGQISIQEESSEEKIEIYPNPTSGKINVLVPSSLGKVQSIELYTIEGKLLYRTLSTEQPLTQINIEAGRGVFLIKVRFQEGKEVNAKILRE
ncbi:FG-GAP-like repeat-containing protein [Owenweeksia hongkongensis]|uniref:FG-GAP-like repeat-containing protein n=1 Tax=Owenweeksia hongkongensis TaxID=253245 RepID=UPI003A8F57B4